MIDQQYILTIDLGTSGPKVALVSEHGEVLGCEVEATDLILLEGGGAEQNPDNWWQKIAAASKKLLAKELIPLDKISAVAVTAQWSGTVAVNKEGKPLHNA
ncbi:MAG TPA: FGGY family carbohydrate kinase, partial [Turneriella sp.]|nr:FGGY family carbohydrate kinase [Turneriella sp.]